MKGGRKVKRPTRSGAQNRRQICGRDTGGGKRAGVFLMTGLLFSLFALTSAYASGGGGSHEGPSWFDFTWRTLNFLILAGVLYWLLAKKIRDFLAGRREGIRNAIAQAETNREEAEKRFREYDAKLSKATGEIEEITRMIRNQGMAEKERIIADARKAAAKMKEDTQARMEQEFSKASRELRLEVVRLSTQMAGELIRKNINVNDNEALVKEYIEKAVNKT
jgi:F-type H+-transporting ATPase subunit b